MAYVNNQINNDMVTSTLRGPDLLTGQLFRLVPDSMSVYIKTETDGGYISLSTGMAYRFSNPNKQTYPVRDGSTISLTAHTIV